MRRSLLKKRTQEISFYTLTNQFYLFKGFCLNNP